MNASFARSLPAPARSPRHRRPRAAAMVLAAVAALSVGACGRENAFDSGREHYLANRLTEALPLFEQAARGSRDAERHAWLAETYRRLDRPDDALASARRSLELDPCEPFAHEVLADVYSPLLSGWKSVNADSTWAHAQAAVACDPDFAGAWLPVWLHGLLRGDAEAESRALRELARLKFFTPAALAYARWMLESAPPRAVLVVNGDMDTYPPLVLQLVEGVRPDVVVVNNSLLNAAGYRRVVRERYGLPIPDALLGEEARPESAPGGELVTVADRIVAGWAEWVARGTFGRPLAISTTVMSSPVAAGRLTLAGASRIVTAGGTPATDTTAVRASLTALEPRSFSGPWVSDADLSPIRRQYSHLLARNLLASADQVATMAGPGSQGASEMRAWATRFAREAGFDAEARAFAEHLGDSTAHARTGHP